MYGKKSLFNSLHRELTNVYKFVLLFLHVYMFVVCMHASIHVLMCKGAHICVGARHACMCVERSEIDFGNFPCFLSALYKEITLGSGGARL